MGVKPVNIGNNSALSSKLPSPFQANPNPEPTFLMASAAPVLVPVVERALPVVARTAPAAIEVAAETWGVAELITGGAALSTGTIVALAGVGIAAVGVLGLVIYNETHGGAADVFTWWGDALFDATHSDENRPVTQQDIDEAQRRLRARQLVEMQGMDAHEANLHAGLDAFGNLPGASTISPVASDSVMRASIDPMSSARSVGLGEIKGEHETYRIIRKLGEGRFGVVYLVKDQHGKEWAAKISKDQYHIKDIKHEIEIRQRIPQHPNIVQGGKSIVENDRIILISEYVNGDDLSEYHKKGPMRERELWELAKQMIAALKATHAVDIVHGDIDKPSNIIKLRRSTDGKPVFKLNDLGFANDLRDDAQRASSNGMNQDFVDLAYTLVTMALPLPAPRNFQEGMIALSIKPRHVSSAFIKMLQKMSREESLDDIPQLK